ncbi:F0F1 ATP synthase subunit epsilon [Campylobacter sp. RM10532]|uniref:F0F1 ATP synthase subunit epsilon n=1 Tax=Campylobacter molothri TaxID=1032242 RepID=A0ACC5W2D1_9BACT|nr:ATP synthase F1 subunit epsilon [Campylobacter sp. RM10537]MBZ7928492.1 F0F1 ATP synthase subunit epsilon [Campylobacter sp. RM10542]MBZ7929925.1 F0F1 ATP synthase subunit epsilon [Campylobacter sp. W0067]MBZ7931377.1 F0F1 ATP synthase subunit epsilon [Campylobacter sp. RM12910]MBZ7934472.1 F0F1 ATP synthase subunit epsilon [Campylobacter sp. W0065]MBZ7940879.1 F0F1 ATP synthase subunit epsilon [Campylobacter sp. W0047]MBZ7943711.1 F0F1 ATP synthase subunit epsilon [Campylobacter sp. RM137
MDNLFKIEIITPMGVIYEGDIKSVTLPGSEGEFGVLKNHAALVSSLKSGIIDIEKNDSNHELIAIDAGHVKVDEDKTSVLAKGAVWISGSDESEIQKNLAKAKELIKSMSSDNIALAATFSKIDNIKG